MVDLSNVIARITVIIGVFLANSTRRKHISEEAANMVEAARNLMDIYNDVYEKYMENEEYTEYLLEIIHKKLPKLEFLGEDEFKSEAKDG